MTKTKKNQKKTDETPKGEDPPVEKIVDKAVQKHGKTFQGAGKEVRK